MFIVTAALEQLTLQQNNHNFIFINDVTYQYNSLEILILIIIIITVIIIIMMILIIILIIYHSNFSLVMGTFQLRNSYKFLKQACLYINLILHKGNNL